MADKKHIDITNRKASFNYHIEDKYQAGMVLSGGEVKSIRAGNINISDAYCYFDNGELWVKNLHISEFKQVSYNKHYPLRDRKLLLNKKELKKITNKAKIKGTAIFPIRLFENERGILKLEIGIGTGKKQFDKRDDIKEKDVKRELDRMNLK